MKNKKKKEIIINEKELINVQNDYFDEIESNKEYSLEVDPFGKYDMSETHKNFIKNYIQFKSIGTAAELSGISIEDAKKYYLSYNSQMEIRRINRALYHRQFAHKLLSLDDLGGYLGSLLTDENVPIADQLKTSEKLKVVNMLMDLIKMKQESLENPDKLMKNDIEIEIKNLSINTIQQLLNGCDTSNIKKDILSNSNSNNLSVEEKEYLETLPVNDLLELLEDTNKRRDINNE